MKNNMKKILIITLFFVFALANASFSQLLVGKLENGQPTLTAKKAKLLTSLNTNLPKASGINGNFNDVTIVKIQDNYFLTFKGEKYKSTFSIQVQGVDMYVQPVTVTCTTSDCADEELGCIPSGTKCTACGNKGKCTKTISNGALISN